ncbi:Transmembrane-domain containing protein [Spironucleus salmonicida]|uniref:Transmembrane-domain containing protein n=1 Tax=Spironucleus salmonicida TaxID=348837 RepID=A0A9P8RUL5_9EUKA|nr:Transmembrane-domain containing protein [Spironucleus salmonicida]
MIMQGCQISILPMKIANYQSVVFLHSKMTSSKMLRIIFQLMLILWKLQKFSMYLLYFINKNLYLMTLVFEDLLFVTMFRSMIFKLIKYQNYGQTQVSYQYTQDITCIKPPQILTLLLQQINIFRLLLVYIHHLNMWHQLRILSLKICPLQMLQLYCYNIQQRIQVFYLQIFWPLFMGYLLISQLCRLEINQCKISIQYNVLYRQNHCLTRFLGKKVLIILQYIIVFIFHCIQRIKQRSIFFSCYVHLHLCSRQSILYYNLWYLDKLQVIKILKMEFQAIVLDQGNQYLYFLHTIIIISLQEILHFMYSVHKILHNKFTLTLVQTMQMHQRYFSLQKIINTKNKSIIKYMRKYQKKFPRNIFRIKKYCSEKAHYLVSGSYFLI